MQISSEDRPARKRFLVALAAAASVVGLAMPTLGQAGARGDKTQKVTVMTRNIYLGAPLGDLFTAPNVNQLKQEAWEELQEVTRTDFPSRAKLLAAEIDQAKADLVGLQEVVHWRLDLEDPDGSGPLDGPAETNFQNFKQILMRELNAGPGPKYRIASEVVNVPDVELPVRDNSPGATDESPDSTGPDFDGRGTFRNLILARRGAEVRTTERKGELFIHPLVLQAGGFPVTINRGWTSVQANVRGAKFRFVNTHLEAFDNGRIRRAQAKELFAKGGPANAKGPVVLVGDFNSGNQTRHNIAAPKDRLAYKVIEKAGFLERQTRAFSCCYSDSMDDPSEVFDHTVDHVFVNTPKIKLGRSFITGDDPNQRTASGLWPSDHGGVVSVLKVPTSG